MKRIFTSFFLVVSLSLMAQIRDDTTGHSVNVTAAYDDSPAYVFGGIKYDGGLTSNELWEVNLGNGQCTKINTSGGPPARADHTAFIKDGKLYIQGGKDDHGNCLGDLWEFDLSTKTWKELTYPNPPSNVASRQTLVVSGNYAYLAGGSNSAGVSSDYFASLDLNNISSGWQPLPPITEPLAGSGSFVNGGGILLFGGVWDNWAGTTPPQPSYSKNTWKYTPAPLPVSPKSGSSGSWSQVTTTALKSGSSGSWSQVTTTGDIKELTDFAYTQDPSESYFYVFGGKSYNYETRTEIFSNEVFRLDLKTSAWTKLSTTLPQALTGFTASYKMGATENSDKIYLLGGKTSANTISGDILVFDVATGTIKESDSSVIGVAFDMPLPAKFADSTKITLKGLPAGLKYNSTTRRITGVPMKPGNFSVAISAPDVPTQTITIVAEALPDWAYGTFNGSCAVNNNSGTATMTVTALGKVTGKLSSGGVNYAFSSASYARRDEDGAFWISTDISVNKADVPLIFAVRDSGSAEIPTLSIAEGWLADIPEGDPEVNMYRNVWKDKDVILAATLKPYIGYYTAVLPGGATFGSGYLAITVDKAGVVKTTGKLADGTVLSLSGTLIIDGNEPACVFTVIYTSPVAYKGGCLFGVAEFAKPVNPEDGDKVYLGLLKGIPFHWVSRNIQATADYGVGFLRRPGLSGGWYDNSINLSDYYEGKLTVGGIVAFPSLYAAVRYTDYDPESEAENPPKKTTTVIEEIGDAGVSPNGLVLSLTFAKEIGIGLSAPKADTPKKDPGTGEYNYDLVNPTGLTLSLTRATGIFKGGFNVYYDYISAENSTLVEPTQTYSHVIKKALYEGVLTPVRKNQADGGGRGFYLWADKSQYKNPQGKTVIYPFNWSYDFLINNEQ